MRKKSTTVILLLILLTGLSLLLYPTVSDYWNSFHQSRAIAGYTERVAEMDTADYEAMWNAAADYNQRLLADTGNRYRMTEAEEEEYESLLDVTGTGIMGYVEIPKIRTSLPIYHGTDDAVLQIAIGHLAGSSLPVGGEGTHCVLTGHRGLPSAKLFTNLDDYCTLVTCTPYGVNTHRLLVRGHRIETPEESVPVPADAVQVDRFLVAPVVAGILIVIIVVIGLLRRKFH